MTSGRDIGSERGGGRTAGLVVMGENIGMPPREGLTGNGLLFPRTAAALA